MTFVLYSLNLNWGTAKKQLFIGFGLFCMIAILHTELLFAEKQVPLNLFNIGDSIGEGEAAYNDIGQFHHELVWSTGYDSSDQIESFNERFEQIFDIQFQDTDINTGDCFHPSAAGMSKMASEQWCRSRWGQFDPQCPAPLLPAIYLLLL